MPEIIHTGKIPVKSWAGNIEESAFQQAAHLSELPFAKYHIALMPDCHSGYGMPIGGVLATENVVIPNAVGVDIGCGMVAVKSSLKELSGGQLSDIVRDLKKSIPTGFNQHKQPQAEEDMPQADRRLNIVHKEFEHARYQLGTLGGGNHFIEIQKGSDGHLWYMIHSGSRHLGHAVATHYNRVAKALNKQADNPVPPKFNLAWMSLDSPEGRLYFAEMEYCTRYAFANRKKMSDTVQKIIRKHSKADFFPIINIAHNYAVREKHFGETLIIHRKGATSAKKGETGIIPGSQGTKSYIVRGKGNPESFMSCSHGAGRILSRTAAKKQLDLDKEIERMNSQGILHGISKTKHLDEAPGAYKNITDVMKKQSDLVEILTELRPLAVIKG